MKNSSSSYLFVYGTLRKEYENEFARLLRSKCTHIGEGFTQGKLFDLGEYPAAVKSEASKIYGDIYELKSPEEILSRLDEYEGFMMNDKIHSEYIRELTDVILPVQRTPHGEKKIKSWIYWYNLPLKNETIIKHGDYNQHVNPPINIVNDDGGV